MVPGTHMKSIDHVGQPASGVYIASKYSEVHDLNSDPRDRFYAASPFE